MPGKPKKLKKRPDPRFLCRIAIFHGPYQKKILTDYSIDISSGGVFIETDTILPEGTDVTVKFNLPDSDRVIVAKAVVSWTNGPEPGLKTSLKSGMGLLFVDLSIDDLHAIRAVLYKKKFVPTW